MFVSDRRWPQLGWPARGPWYQPTVARNLKLHIHDVTDYTTGYIHDTTDYRLVVLCKRSSSSHIDMHTHAGSTFHKAGIPRRRHDTDTDTDILARILAGMSNTRAFLKLFLWQAERHADILATILTRISARMSVSV